MASPNCLLQRLCIRTIVEGTDAQNNVERLVYKPVDQKLASLEYVNISNSSL